MRFHKQAFKGLARRRAALLVLVVTTATTTAHAQASGPARSGSGDQDRFLKVASYYKDLAGTDKENSALWAFCSAVAFKAGSTRSPSDAHRYAVETVASMKQMMPDARRTPCPDAISPALWSGTGDGSASSATVVEASPTDARARASQETGRDKRRERGEAAIAATVAEREGERQAAAAKREQDRERVTEEAKAKVEAELLKRAPSVSPGVMKAAGAAQELMAAMKSDGEAQRNIVREEQYAREVRAARLLKDPSDVVGFPAARRPSQTEVALASSNARLKSFGFIPARSEWAFNQAKEILRIGSEDWVFTQAADQGVNPEDYRSAFSASTIALVQVHFVLESPTGALPKVGMYACSAYTPDGEQILTKAGRPLWGMAAAHGDQRAHEVRIQLVARAWQPGAYGVECGPFGGKALVNGTFDLVP